MTSTSVDLARERDGRDDRAQRDAAERVVDELVAALELAGLPPLPALAAARLTNTPLGVHVELGGCGVRVVQALAGHLTAHARCTGRIITGTVLPPGLAELSPVRPARPEVTR
ncbi:hypothetical protein GCM10009665_20250 [Kitasatospora nipponensis]|uniref:Uncharacterized protein n=1 Tax=Kitasatospora nipponensis TaxID=258049 RepID=A0ABP4GM05_9ACTN